MFDAFYALAYKNSRHLKTTKPSNAVGFLQTKLTPTYVKLPILIKGLYAKQILRFVLLSLLFGILQIARAQNQATAEKIRIDPAAAMGGTVSQYIDKVKFILLEDTKESVFGTIDQVEVTDSFYIILDNNTQAIILFTKQGRYHSKIKLKYYIPDFKIRGNLIEVPDYPFYSYYDLDAKLVKQITPKKYGNDRTYLGDNVEAQYIFNPGEIKSSIDSTAFKVQVLEGDKITHKYFPYNTRLAKGLRNWVFHFFNNYENNDTAKYVIIRHDYTVYRITPLTCNAVYQFIFPLQYSLPNNFLTDTALLSKNDDVDLNASLISELYNFYKIKNLISFRTSQHKTYLYETATQKLVWFDKIISDSTSYFLPVTDAEARGSDVSIPGLINFDGTNFYTSYSSLQLFNRMEATKIKNPKYPPELVKYFSNPKNRKGNPVLVQIKFKKTL